MDNRRIYFKGLNGLRFFAALGVIFTHIELIKDNLGLHNLWRNPFFFEIGSLGVYFFFVLSGFLITYLLLVEKRQTNTINITSFYLRRILRIWPLYYFIVLLGFFLFPQIDFLKMNYFSANFHNEFWQNLILYILILPNLAFSIYPAVPHIGQTWSIGVEEQFYLLWPIVVYKIKNLEKFLILFIAIYVLMKGILVFSGELFNNSHVFGIVKKLFAMSKFECMAIGAFGAYSYFYSKQKLISLLYNTYIQIVAYLIIPILIYFTPSLIQDGIHIVYAFVFLVIIINVSTNNRSLINLDFPIFDFLGRISYGIYMYHLIIVFISVKIYMHFFKLTQINFFSNLFIYLISILLTILVSYMSYEFFEKRFLKLKEYYSVIISGRP